MTPEKRRGLMRAAEQIGATQYAVQRRAAHGRPSFRYHPTVTHLRIVDALNRDVDDETAVALMTSYEAMAERWPA
jgi:hypothetical protein